MREEGNISQIFLRLCPYEDVMKRFMSLLLMAVSLGTFSQTSRAQWHEVDVRKPNGQSYIWAGIHFVDSLSGWVVGNSARAIGRTRNGGLAWTVVESTVPSWAVNFNAVYFADTLHGIIAGSSGFGNGPGVIIRTTNGGQTWSQVTHPAANSLWEEIAVVGDSLWVIGSYWDNSRPYHGIMLRTPVTSLFSSSPIPWSFYQYPQFRGFREISAVNQNLVWISGGGWNDTTANWQASLVHTTDGGRTFLNDAHKVATGTRVITEIAFADSVHGWLCVSPDVYATVDGGETWFLQSTTLAGPVPLLPLTPQILYKADANPNPPFAIRIEISTNGGITWLAVADGQVLDGGINFFKLDNEHMWLLGHSAIWYFVPVPEPVVVAIPDTTIMVGESFAYQVQAQGMGLQYSLTGAPWLSISQSGLITGTPALADTGDWRVTVTVRDTVAQFATASFTITVLLPAPAVPVLVLPLNGALEQPTHLQLRWQSVLTASQYHLMVAADSSFAGGIILNDSTLTDTSSVLDSLANASTYHWRVRAYNSSGYGGWSEVRWFRTSTTGAGEPEDLPREYSLQQNYPNPFNPTTNIEFRVADFGFVSFKAFDLLGREVATLVNGRLEAGTHRVEFDASALSSGVYLYRLAAGKFTSTRKMLLLR
jgi:hypothetical protein